MEDDEINKNINKCTRCALCVKNCPVYSITNNENNTARGLISKLLGFKKGLLNENEIKKNFQFCLECSKCKTNCPSKIDTIKIFSYFNAQLNPSKISQGLLLKLKLLPVRVLYFINLFKKNKKPLSDSSIIYFKGCVAKAQNKTTYLDKMFKTLDFSCCGLPYLTSGDIKNYNKAKEKNLEFIKNADKILFDCASCKSAFEEYNIEKEKLFFITDFLKDKKLKPNSKYKNKTIVFHKPCHLSNEDFEKIEVFLMSIKDINYKKLENPDYCCGFGGSYFLLHPVISSKIALKKARTIKSSNADLILTACPSCTMGLRFNQLISFNFKKTLELRDFIDKELE